MSARLVAAALFALCVGLPGLAHAEAPAPAPVAFAAEAHEDRVLPLLAEGRVADARSEARHAVRLNPGSVRARMLLAWALRHADKGFPGTYGLAEAGANYARVTDLAPTSTEGACGLAHAKREQGDRIGARLAFSQLLSAEPSNLCALQGARATQPRWRVTGTFYLLGAAYDGHPTQTGGAGTTVSGRAVFDDLLHIEVTARLLAVGAEISGVKVTGGQVEAWGRVGVSHRGMGAEFLGAVVKSSADTQAASVLGGRAWATFGVTLRGEAAVSSFEDGTALQAGAGLFVPVFSVLSVDVAAQVTRWVPEAGTATAPAVMLEGSLILTPLDALTVRVTGRGGRAWSPVRFSEPSVWNTEQSQTAGAEFLVSGRLNRWLSLHGSWEVARLLDDSTNTSSHTHVFGLGITVETEGGMRR